MAINGIPEVLNDYNAYLSGNRLVGTTGEVKLPDLEGLTETVKGCGILGEFETVITGRYGDMEQEIVFNMLSEDVFKMIDTTKAVELVLRGSQQYTDRAAGNVDQMGMRVVFRGRAKKLSPGDMKQGKAMNGSVTLGLTYIYIELDGSPKFELDKLNSVFKVNGVDLLAKVRKYT